MLTRCNNFLDTGNHSFRNMSGVAAYLLNFGLGEDKPTTFSSNDPVSGMFTVFLSKENLTINTLAGAEYIRLPIIHNNNDLPYELVKVVTDNAIKLTEMGEHNLLNLASITPKLVHTLTQQNGGIDCTVITTIGNCDLHNDVYFFNAEDQLMETYTYTIQMKDLVSIKDVSVPVPEQPISRLGNHYVNEQTVEDYITRTERTYPPEQMWGVYKWTIGKYLDRLGKKDDPIRELRKVIDYSNRFIDYIKRNKD